MLHCIFSTRYLTVSNNPSRQAKCRGVSPWHVVVFTSQLLTSFTISKESRVQATCNGNCPAQFWIDMLHCIFSTRYLTVSNNPSRQAMCKGVSPCFVLALISQLVTNCTTSTDRIPQAKCRGNSFRLFCANVSACFTWIRYCTITSVLPAESFLQAMCNGVFPSFVFALTSQLLTSFIMSRDACCCAHAICRGSSPRTFEMFSILKCSVR